MNRSTGRVPQRSILGLSCVKTISNLKDVMELTLINTADDNKLGELVNKLEGRTAIQND